MLSGLIAEIVRRRLWPIPLVAVLVAVAAPLLFLKSSPATDALPAQGSAGQVAVDVSASDKLPVRARQLLDTDSAAKRKTKKRPKAADPFQAPSSVRAAPSGASADESPASSAAAAGPSSAATEQKPVPVVITDSKGKAQEPATTDSGEKTSDDSSSGPGSTYTAVDVRFAVTSRGAVQRKIPRLTPLKAGGLVVASFVKYSASRNRAVFAVSPNTIVSGSVDCRRIDELCRYIDLRAGRSVRITIVGSDGKALTRRLTVVRIRSVSGSAPKSPLAGQCLLSKLVASEPGDPAVSAGVCD